MNTLKQHLALIIPLLALLFSLQSILWIDRAIASREDKLLQSYSILIASKSPLQLEILQKILSDAAGLDQIDSAFLLQRFEGLSSEDLQNIQKDLPLFYSLKLKSFPSLKELNHISQSLKTLPQIVRVETFAKIHNQVYKLLYFTKGNILIFATLLGIFSLLLMIRQIQVWRYQYQKRMRIMDLLGAGFWLKNSFLFKTAILDSLIASVAITSGGIYLSMHRHTQEMFEYLGIQGEVFAFGHDFALLLLVSVAVSLFCVSFVILLQRKD